MDVRTVRVMDVHSQMFFFVVSKGFEGLPEVQGGPNPVFHSDERTARHSTVEYVRKVRNLSAKCAGAVGTGSHDVH